jgi:hypothetical protein
MAQPPAAKPHWPCTPDIQRFNLGESLFDLCCERTESPPIGLDLTRMQTAIANPAVIDHKRIKQHSQPLHAGIKEYLFGPFGRKPSQVMSTIAEFA